MATTLSSREFNHDAGRARKAAQQGPVFITNRGQPTLVLLSIEEYRRLTEQAENIIDQLGLPEGIEDVEIDLPTFHDMTNEADFA